MTKKNYLYKLKGIPFIDLWSMFYLFMVYFFTMILEQANIVVFGIYVVLAVPFINFLDKFACICFLLSTMSYYFLGGDEGVWSLYTILAMMIILRLFVQSKINVSLKSTLFFAWMIASVALSYSFSKFGYSMGMFAIIYNILIAILIATTIKLNKDTLVSFLPKIAAFQIVAYIGMLLINGHYDGYGFSVSERINHNTFGASVSILSVILAIKVVFGKEKSFLYKFIWGVSLILIVVAGSRNALLAMALTFVIVYIVYQKQQGKVISGVFKFLVLACVVAFVGSLLLPEFGVDLYRYDYVELISSGGSNRTIIWETLSPVIWKEHKWFGYGPGHFCSEQMINSYMNLDYKHTHNTLFEAWGELGLFGFVPFLLILWLSFKKSCLCIKNKSHYLVVGFLFIEFLLLGLGESMFANIELWIIIGFLVGSKKSFDASDLSEDVELGGIK